MGKKATYLARNHYGAEKDTLACPFLEGDLEMGFSAINVDECDKKSGEGDFCSSEDIGDECGKFGLLRVAGVPAAATGRRWTTHCVIDCVYDTINDVFWDNCQDE